MTSHSLCVISNKAVLVLNQGWCLNQLLTGFIRAGLVYHNQRANSEPRHCVTKKVLGSKCFILPLL